MDRSVAQALTGLIPSLTGPLPQELVELAISLLAQSRNKASSLKAEEEIARSYALKLSLGLPKIEPRPPCPPRIYQKLYKYLDSALTAGTRRSSRPARIDGTTSTPTSSPAKPQTPAKAAKFKTPTPRKRANTHAVTATEVPEWVMPTIRHLCKALGAPAAPHHVFAGVSSILTQPAPRSGTEKASNDASREVNISALIIVVYLLVVTRLKGNQMPAQETSRLRSLAIASIRESGFKEPSEEVADSEHVVVCVVDWMRDIGAKGWTELDWFANIGQGTGLDVDEPGDGEDGDLDIDEIALEGTNSIVGHLDLGMGHEEDQHILRPGLGTMMQDRVDYLSEKRLQQYQTWKKEILLRCDEIEKARMMDESAD